MFWLITYSQQEKGRNAIKANTVTDVSPAQWLILTMNKCPDDITILLFAIEITVQQYRILLGET